MLSSRFLMKLLQSAPIMKHSSPSHSSKVRQSPWGLLFRMSSTFLRLVQWLKRMVSKMACLTVSLGRLKSNLAQDSVIERASAISWSYATSLLMVWRASMALSVLNMMTLAKSSRLALISAFDLTFMPPFSSTKGQKISSLWSFFLIFSSSNRSLVTSILSLSSAISSGSCDDSSDSQMFSRIYCLTLASASGCLMAAKGGSFPLPIFLKSSRMTFFPSLLTMLIISWTSSGVCGWFMHFRKNDSSSAVMQPSLLMSMVLKASLMSSSENSSLLISYPVFSVLKVFLVDIFLPSASSCFSVPVMGWWRWP